MAFPASRSQAKRNRYSRYLGLSHEVGACAFVVVPGGGSNLWQGTSHDVGSLTSFSQFLGTSHDVGSMGFRQRYDSTEHEVGACAFSTAPAVYANGYVKRARIRVPASSIQFTGTLPFTMLVAETEPFLMDVAHGGYVQSNVGRDIRFELTNGTWLPHILDTYNPATGKIVAWVRWPGLVAGQANDLFIYAGNSTYAVTFSALGSEHASGACSFAARSYRGRETSAGRASFSSALGEANPAGASVDFLQWLNPRTGVDNTGQPGRSLTPTSIGSADMGLGDSADFNGTTSVASAAPWAGWGGWGAVTLDVWVQADADAVGKSSTIYSQGTGTGSSGNCGIILHWRDTATAPQDQITNPMLFSVWGSVSGQGEGFILTQANVQSSAKMHLCSRWTSGQVPRISKNTTALSPALKDDGTPFAVAGSGTVTVQPGSIWLGKGADTTDHPASLWKGLMGPVRLRASDISDGQLKTEYANQLDPKSFYGIGGWDSVTESNNAPVAVPEPAFTVVQNTATLLDVVGNDYEPDGQNKKLLSFDTPSAGISSVTLSGGKALLTPAAGFAGDTTFFYTMADVPSAGATAKTSRGKVHATISGDPPPSTDELPAPKRRILVPNDTVLTEVIRTSSPSFTNATVQIVLAGTSSAPPVTAGDEIVLADGTYSTARTISLKGSAAFPIRFKAANKQKAVITNTWVLQETYKTLWGFWFKGVAARLNMGGQGNGALRCEFTGWGRGNCITGLSNAITGDSGGEGKPGCFVSYCSLHDAADWGATGAGDPTTPISQWTNILRMGIRSGETNPKVTTFPYNWHINRCDFYNFNDKPVPTDYGTGQANIIEWAQNGPSIAAESLTATRSGGHVTGILTYMKSGLIFEDNVVRDCPEGSGTGAASVDFKCGGNIIRRLVMRNCPGRSDNRAGPFNTWQDILWDNSRGMWSSGYGHTIERTSGGITLAITSGNMDAAGTAGTASVGSPDNKTFVGFQNSEHCVVRDIDSPLVVGKDATDMVYNYQGHAYEDPLFKARDIAVSRVSPAPSGNAYPDNSLRESCTYVTGTVAAPQNLPTNASVGVNATWVG